MYEPLTIGYLEDCCSSERLGSSPGASAKRYGGMADTAVNIDVAYLFVLSDYCRVAKLVDAQR